MRERKKTAVHGTLGIGPMAWKFNSKQLLCKTLHSRINIIEARADLNMVKEVGKCVPKAKREGLELIYYLASSFSFTAAALNLMKLISRMCFKQHNF